MGYGRQYTDEEKQFILDNYKGISTKELTERFNSYFNLNIKESSLKAYKSNHKLWSGYDCCFRKGNIPHNKGKKMSSEIYEKCKGTMFKKEHVPINHREIGSERVIKDGYIEIKIEEPNKWRLKHNVVYEKHYGEIPKGSVVIMLDGNKQNTDISNLKLITRSELLIMNRYGFFNKDKELTVVGSNLAQMIDTRNKAKKRFKEKNK